MKALFTKLIYIFIFSFLYEATSAQSKFANLFYNGGAVVTVQGTALLHVQGDVVNQTGSDFINNGVLQLEGDFTNQSSTAKFTIDNAGSGSSTREQTVRFVGGATVCGTASSATRDQSIIGDMNTANVYFQNLVMDKEAAGNTLTLQGNVEVKGSLVWGCKTTGSATFTAFTGATDQVRGASRSSGFGIIRTHDGTTDKELYVSNGSVNSIIGYQTVVAATASDATKDQYIENRGVKATGLGGLSRNITATGSDYYYPLGTSTNTYQAVKFKFSTVPSAPNKVRGMFIDNAAAVGTVNKTLDCTNSNFTGISPAITCSGTSITYGGATQSVDNNGYNVFGSNTCTGKKGWYVIEKTATNHGYWSFEGGATNEYAMEVYPRSFSYTGSLTEGSRVIKKASAITADPTGVDWTTEIFSSTKNGLADLFGYSKWPSSGGGNTNSCSTSSGALGIPGGVYTGFSHFQFAGPASSDNPLPVELTYLRADPIQNTYIKVSWQTATEINNKGFEIKRSTDGVQFETIGWEAGNGNSSSIINYDYDDRNVNPNQTYYYKLNQIDYDGKNEETYIVSAKISDGFSFVIGDFVPNPTQADAKLTITTTDAQLIEVKLFNILGAEVLHKNYQLIAGSNLLSFESSGLADATYTAIIKAGNNVYSKKLVVARY